MNILLLDDDYLTIEQLKCLTQLKLDWRVVKPDKISFDKIDLVIVDIFKHKNREILENILKINPKVRTITVSDKLSSKTPQGCEYCETHYNRIRLLKPIHLRKLLDTIDNFDEMETCQFKDTFSSIEKLIPILLEKFNNLIYDEDSQIVSTTLDLESKDQTIQLLNFLTLLDQNQIQYTLLDGNAIKIKV